MSDGARDEKKDGRSGAVHSATEGATPRHSHIRELAPKIDVEVDDSSTNEDHKNPGRTGFLAQATRISMGNAFPALRSFARLLSLESYRSLPKLDKLPDLDDEIIEADLDDLLESEDDSKTSQPELLDWDELEADDLRPTPYQMYLFDLRIENYLKQTKAELAQHLTRTS